MKRIPLSQEIKAVAGRVIWFEEPEKAVTDPVRFLTYAMTYGSHKDIATIRRHVTDDDLRAALDHPPPGIMDPRSWSYWHLKLGRYPAPPPPKRDL